jgi:hypothetical protein
LYVNCGARGFVLFAPADRRQAPPLRERQRELRRARRVGGASGPAGRLETVQIICTDEERLLMPVASDHFILLVLPAGVA